MAYQNHTSIKLGKSLANLKKELILSKRLLTSYPFPKITNVEQKTILKVDHQLDSKNVKNKHVFGHIVDFIKSMINSNTLFQKTHPRVTELISFINEAQMKRSLQVVTEQYKPLHYINVRNYCSCAKKCKDVYGRHKYHKETEVAMNEQISAELTACYAYLSMACYFGRTEVALPGCYGLFMKMHEEEHEHALSFINYQIMRGGHVKLSSICAPECQEWCIQRALSVAIEMEIFVKEKMTKLHDVAELHHDLSVMDLIASHFILEQERSICELSRLLYRAGKVASNGLGEYLFDKEVHRAFVKKIDKTYIPKWPEATQKTDKIDKYI